MNYELHDPQHLPWPIPTLVQHGTKYCSGAHLCRLVIVSINGVYPEPWVQSCVGGDAGTNEHGTAAGREDVELNQVTCSLRSPAPSLCGPCLVLQIKKDFKMICVGVAKELVDNSALIPVGEGERSRDNRLIMASIFAHTCLLTC